MLGKKAIEQLLISLDELELNILAAERSLRNANMPKWVHERLDTYKEIVKKQRMLAAKLGSLEDNDFDQLFSTLNRINTLSTLIFSDSEELVNALTKSEREPLVKKDFIVC